MEKQSGFSKIMDTVLPATQKFQNTLVITSIMRGMMGAMPVLMISALLQIIYNFPIDAWIQFLQRIGLYDLFAAVVTISNMIVLFVSFGIGYAFTTQKNGNSLVGGFVALLCTLVVLPITVTPTDFGNFSTINVDDLGAQGLFTAIFVSLLSAAMYCFYTSKNLVIKLPEAVPEFVSKSFAGIPATVLTVIPFIIVRGLFSLTDFETLNGFIYTVVQTPLVGLGNSLVSHLICLFLACFFWWFGIHGTLVVLSVMMPIWQVPMIENIMAVAQGMPAPHILSFMSFFIVIQFFGGPGCLFGLHINAFLFAKSARFKAHKKLSFVPGMFNIIEPAVYGMPIAFNLLLLLPFILTPLIIYTLYYILASIGIIGIPSVMLGIMIIPGPVAAFLLGGGISLGIFILLGLLLSCFTYFPFFKAMDKQALKEELANAEQAEAELANETA